MPMSILECSYDPLEPTIEESEKLAELEILLRDYIVNPSVSEPIRDALESYINDQQFLLKYIRGRKSKVDKAFHSLISYADVRFVKYGDLFPSKVPDYVMFALKSGLAQVLHKRDHLGRTITIFDASKWDPSEISLNEMIIVGRLCIDVCMNMPSFLKHGLLFILNLDGVSITALRHVTVSITIKFLNLFLQAYPIPIKGIYVVNAPFIGKPIYAFVKALFPQKLKERILITSGVSEFHKRVSPDILPEYLGGKLRNEDVQSQAILNHFARMFV